jgi:TolB-like protein/DNA-binding winged helix-turn-helix (wHTH) protein
MDGEQFTFGRFCLDLGRRRLLNDEKPVRFGSRGLDILCVLASAEGKVVSKDELMAQVWPGVMVEENNLHVHISALRKALAEEDAGQTYLVTVPGRGYRLVGLQNTGPQATPVGDRPGALPLTPSAQHLAAPRLSIVVLPFANLSDDREQQYFADGITEDLTIDLSRLANMFVISRNTACIYRNTPIDTKQIGRELCVRYVLEGSVRRSGNQVRVSAQLIDAATDAHLWAERFDRDTGDLLAVQNEITSRLANALGVALIAAESARPTEHPDALDYSLRGRAVTLRPSSRDVYAEAISLFEKALALDPQSVEAQSRLANSLAGRVLDRMTDSAAADLARAEGLVGRVLAASPHSAYAHQVKGLVLRAHMRWEEAIPELETTLASNRNWVSALASLGWCKLSTGSIDEVIPLVKQAIRLSPRDPDIGWWYFLIGTVHFLQSRTDEAIVWLEVARSAMPSVPIVRSGLASAYALKGETERAAAELAEARRLDGGDLFKSIARVKAGWGRGVPKIGALFEATYFAGLRKAGMPEE